MSFPSFGDYDAHFVSPRIAVGRHPSPQDVDAIAAAGIRGIINTVSYCGRYAMEYVCHLPDDILWLLVGYWDGWLGPDTPSYPERLTQGYALLVVEKAAEILRDHSPVLVHCMAGIGRSANLATILVAATENISLEDANAQIRSHRTICGRFMRDGFWKESDPEALVQLTRDILASP